MQLGEATDVPRKIMYLGIALLAIVVAIFVAIVDAVLLYQACYHWPPLVF